MKVNFNKKKYYTYLFAFIGFFYICYYVWFRFIRERLPRDIPFNLTLLSFIVILSLCSIYIYIIFRLFKPKNTHIYFVILLRFFNKILEPLNVLDDLLKTNTYFKTMLFNVYFNIIIFFNLCETNNNKKFFLIYNILPKILLLVFFGIDIFYLKKLELFYYIIFLGIIPLIYEYSIYSIKKQLHLLTELLDKNYYVKVLSTEVEENKYIEDTGFMPFMVFLSDLKYNDYGVLDSHYFIEIQANNLIFDYSLYKYTCIETGYAREIYAKKNDIELPIVRVFEPESDEISKKLSKEFFKIMPQAYRFKAFLDTHYHITKKGITKWNMGILTGYLICWIYILIISLHTLNLSDILNLLDTIELKEEPFSNIKIKK